MTEKVIKQYFCDFCGAEIDQKSKEGIRVFNANHNKDGLVIKPVYQSMDAHRHVAIRVEQGDFCNMDHFVQHIEKRLADERRCKGMQ